MRGCKVRSHYRDYDLNVFRGKTTPGIDVVFVIIVDSSDRIVLKAAYASKKTVRGIMRILKREVVDSHDSHIQMTERLKELLGFNYYSKKQRGS